MSVRHASLAVLALGLAVAACGGGGNPTTAPSSPAASPSAGVTTPAPATSVPESVAPSVEPTSAPSTTEPGASLDPSQSDAGVVGSVTIPADTRGDRSGTHTIVGVKDDGFGSGCSYSFEGDEFTAVAWFDDAPNGQIHQMAVTVPTDEMPANDGEQRAGILDGVVYVDFVSESGFGTAYTGDADGGDGSATIDVSVSGDLLTFDFQATTWDSIAFSGQMVCQGAEL